ncbi:MAG: CARDB domain-containing protein [Gemmatimonadota bacterium]
MRRRIAGYCFVMFLFALPTAGLTQVAQQAAQVGTSCLDKVQVSELKKAAVNPAPDVYKFLITISNLCTGSSSGSITHWRLTKAGSATPLGSGTVLIPASGTAVVNAFWPVSSGTFSFTAMADPENTLNEPAVARANNRQTLQLTVGALAGGTASCNSADKVRMASIALSPTPSTITPGQQVTVNAIISNLCPNGSRNFDWRILVDGATVASGTTSSMTYNENKLISTTWTAIAGTHQIVAEVDPQNLQGETGNSATYNNKRTVQVTLTTASGSQGQ